MWYNCYKAVYLILSVLWILIVKTSDLNLPSGDCFDVVFVEDPFSEGVFTNVEMNAYCL